MVFNLLTVQLEELHTQGPFTPKQLSTWTFEIKDSDSNDIILVELGSQLHTSANDKGICFKGITSGNAQNVV